MTNPAEQIINYFNQLDEYYLGSQLAIDDECRFFECHMFIIKSKKHTGRGNIEIMEDNSIQWFYTLYTNTDKEKYVPDLKKTPEWFQQIYYNTLNISSLQAQLNNQVRQLA